MQGIPFSTTYQRDKKYKRSQNPKKDFQLAGSDGAPRASPWPPKTIPTYAKASVGHPQVSEIRRSIID